MFDGKLRVDRALVGSRTGMEQVALALAEVNDYLSLKDSHWVVDEDLLAILALQFEDCGSWWITELTETLQRRTEDYEPTKEEDEDEDEQE